MKCIMKNCSIRFALLAMLACVALIAGCASSGKLSQPAAVPEFAPGFLVGYLPRESLPNSLALLPPSSRRRIGCSGIRRGDQPKGSHFARYVALDAGE